MANIYGYIRVSTRDQNEDRQLIALRELKIPEKNIFMDPQGKNLNPGNITQALKAVSSLQLSKSIQPIILDYDESNLTLHIVDKGFLIWLSMQDRNELLSTVGLPEMT